MSDRRADVIQFRKGLEYENPWLAKCCWSCKHCDVTYDLKSLMCTRLQKKVAYNHVCNIYQANQNNPYQQDQPLTVENSASA